MARAPKHRVLHGDIERVSRNSYIREIPQDALRVGANQGGSIPSFAWKLDDNARHTLGLSLKRELHGLPRFG